MKVTKLQSVSRGARRMMKRVSSGALTLVLAGALALGGMGLTGVASYATEPFPELRILIENDAAGNRNVIEGDRIWNSQLSGFQYPIYTEKFQEHSRWTQFHSLKINEEHKASLARLDESLSTFKAGKDVVKSLESVKTELDYLYNQIDKVKALGRPQALLDALRRAIDTLDSHNHLVTHKPEVDKAWRAARASLTNINKLLKHPNAKTLVYLNGLEVYSPDVQPHVINGRTFVAIAPIAEALKLKVSWNGETRTATFEGLRIGGVTPDVTAETGKERYVRIEAKMGADYLTVYRCNNEYFQTGVTKTEVKMDTKVQAIGGRTMIPARFFMEAYNPHGDALWRKDVRETLSKVGAGYDLISLYSSYVINTDEARDLRVKNHIMDMNVDDIEMYSREFTKLERDGYMLLSQQRAWWERKDVIEGKGNICIEPYDKVPKVGRNGKLEMAYGGSYNLDKVPEYNVGDYSYPLDIAYSYLRGVSWARLRHFNYADPASVAKAEAAAKDFAFNSRGVQNLVDSKALPTVYFTDFSLLSMTGDQLTLGFVECGEYEGGVFKYDVGAFALGRSSDGSLGRGVDYAGKEVVFE